MAGKPHRDPLLGYWLLPMPTIDPAVVARSGAALASYGPAFRYSHYAGTKTLRYAAGGAAGVTAIAVSAQVKPLRNLLLGLAVATVLVARTPGSPRRVRRAASMLLAVLLGQGLVGFVQYATDLPVVLVAVHLLGAAVVSAALTWLLLSVRDRDASRA